jgi:hypothetical protein
VARGKATEVGPVPGPNERYFGLIRELTALQTLSQPKRTEEPRRLRLEVAVKPRQSVKPGRKEVVDLFPGAVDEAAGKAWMEQFPEFVAACPFSTKTGEARVVSPSSGSVCHGQAVHCRSVPALDAGRTGAVEQGASKTRKAQGRWRIQAGFCEP